ncbi:MAG: hypothetical protein KF784_03020 [Fimbriimonadaceae bacterium]|nr:hypothetical protein [Fimbriimonadaceae bacterium]
MAQRVWTTQRKFMGNFLPALFSLPFGVLGFFAMFRQGQLIGSGLLWFALWPLSAIVLVNFLGLFQNGQMRQLLAKRLSAPLAEPKTASWFVGFARPAFKDLLDPHEDVGFLVLRDDRIEFLGESIQVEIQKRQIHKISFRPNVHTIIGLGGWLSVDGTVDGTRVRLLVEPREKKTLLGNLLLNRRIRKKLRAWHSPSAEGDDNPEQ